MSSASDSQNNSANTYTNSASDSAESIYMDSTDSAESIYMDSKPYYTWSDTESDNEDDPVEWNTCQLCKEDAPSRQFFCCNLCFATYHPVCLSPGWISYRDPRYISWICPKCASPKASPKATRNKRKRDEIEDGDESSSE